MYLHRSFSLLFTALVLLCCVACMAFTGNKGTKAASDKSAGIEWISIEEAAKRSQKKPKKIFIDVYTDWCGWCKKMDKDTFSDPEIAAYVNKHFYAVKFDAEGKAPITLNGRTYNFRPENRVHELAIELLQGKMGYPTTVYLDEKFNMINPQPGYLTIPQFDKILHFYGENHYKTQSFQDFEKTYAAKK